MCATAEEMSITGGYKIPAIRVRKQTNNGGREKNVEYQAEFHNGSNPHLETNTRKKLRISNQHFYIIYGLQDRVCQIPRT